MPTYRDPERLRAFKRAISLIAGEDAPPRSKLNEIGRELAAVAGRGRRWTGKHLYNLLHFHELKLPVRYGVHSTLLDAALERAGITALNGTHRVRVVAARVREGAVVLAKSRRCARKRCGIHFVPRTPNQRYCSDDCERRIAAFRRKRRRRLGLVKARRQL